LVNEKSELMREVKRLSQLVESLNVEKQNHHLEMSAHHRTVRQLERELEELKLEQKNTVETDQLRLTVQQLETKNEELKIRVKLQTEAYQKLEKDRIQSNPITTDVDRMKIDYDSRLIELQSKLDFQIVEVKTLKEQLDMELSEKQRLTESIEMLNQTIRNLETDRSTLITDFEQTVKVVDARMQECKQLREELSQKTTQFDNEKKQWQNQLQSLKKQSNINGSPSMDPIKKHLEEVLNEEREKLKSVQKDNTELLSQLNELSEKNVDLSNEKISLIDQLAQWQRYYEEQAQYNDYQQTYQVFLL
jgi:FtsZ-binding cell division protein ZapB